MKFWGKNTQTSAFVLAKNAFVRKNFFVAGEREIGIDVSLSVVVDFDLLFFVKASLCVYVIYLKQHSPVAQVTWKKITKYVHISLATPPGAEFDTPRFSTNLL